jgi:hypothetical protein
MRVPHRPQKAQSFDRPLSHSTVNVWSSPESSLKASFGTSRLNPNALPD